MRFLLPFAYLFILCPTSFAALEGSVEFLSKSPLLRRAKLNIAPVEIQGERVLLLVMWEKKENGALLGVDGKVHDLAYVDDGKTYDTSVKMCGEIHRVAARVLPHGEKPNGRFLVLGKIPKGFSVRWLPAEESKKALPSSCNAPRKGFLENQHALAKIPSLPGEVFYSLYDGPGLRKHKKENTGKPNETCARETWQIQRLGTINDGRCSVLLDDNMSCEGTGMYQGVLGKPLGMIEIAQGKETEQWLVFGAQGFEGTAYLGLRLTNKRPTPKSDLHFYVFSGC